MRRILPWIFVVAFFASITLHWRVEWPLVILCFSAFYFYEQRLRRIEYFSLDTYSLIEFYLRKKYPIDNEITDRILKSILNDENFVSYINIKKDVYGNRTSLHLWQRTREKESKSYEDRVAIREKYNEMESFDGEEVDAKIWEFSIEDYITEEECKKIFNTKELSPGLRERLVIEVENGIVQIYAHGGRFGETYFYVEGYRDLRKPENIFLRTNSMFLKGLKFRQMKDNKGAPDGRFFTKEQGCQTYGVHGYKDSEIFGNWKYSVKNL